MFNAWSGIAPEIIVGGRVGNFDKKNVTLHRDGGEVVVPRNSIPKHFEVKSGAYVQAVLKSDFILKEIEKAKKEQKKQVQKKKK